MPPASHEQEKISGPGLPESESLPGTWKESLSFLADPVLRPREFWRSAALLSLGCAAAFAAVSWAVPCAVGGQLRGLGVMDASGRILSPAEQASRAAAKRVRPSGAANGATRPWPALSLSQDLSAAFSFRGPIAAGPTPGAAPSSGYNRQ